MAHGEIRIGISGWHYKEWRGGAYYPKGLRPGEELAFIAGRFDTVEINGTFYGLQTPARFGAWSAATPADFLFAVKGPRFITHILRLENVAAPLANFFASGVLRLGDKLGPILWQLPASFAFERERIAAFLDLLPHDLDEAAALARRHDDHLKGRPFLEVETNRRLRHAVEIRHESFRDAAFTTLLRDRGVALVCADTVDWPLLMDLTADFAYCRLHGSESLYRSGYDAPALRRWAKRVRAWTEGRVMTDGDFVDGPDRSPSPRDVFVYFDNTAKLRAPEDALALAEMVGRGSNERVAAG